LQVASATSASHGVMIRMDFMEFPFFFGGHDRKLPAGIAKLPVAQKVSLRLWQ
jgi:hypothetical protein